MTMLAPDAHSLKPLVFVSHIHEDAPIATALDQFIRRALLGGVAVFNTSNRASLEPGDPWRDLIISQLRACVVALIIATPESVRSPWVNFESGGAWVADRRVIPCCAKGMTKSSLPAPLGHLQALELTDPQDLQQLVGYLARSADLDQPTSLDYTGLIKEIEEAWTSPTDVAKNLDIRQQLQKLLVRPNRYIGQSVKGTFGIMTTAAVTPTDAKQLPNADLKPGDSISCTVQHHGLSLFSARCFAKGEVADEIADTVLPAEFQLELRCLGQMKVIEGPFVDYDEPDRGIEYEAAFLICSVSCP
jgi:TIR domain-containing protein